MENPDPDLLDNAGNAIYLPMIEPGETAKKLVKMSDTGLDVFSYELYPKFISTTKVESKLREVFRFFFDYDEDLGGVPFVEIPSHTNYGATHFDTKQLICKLKDGKATITKLQAEEDLPEYVSDIEDTEHFKVAPNKILVSHSRCELISFSYTKSPLEFKSTISYPPMKKVDRMFPTDNKDVFCGFGFSGGSSDKLGSDINKFTLFFYNILTDKFVDYLKVDYKQYSEVHFAITDYGCWEIIQDLEDKNTFKVFAAEYVFEIKLQGLVKKFEYSKRWQKRGTKSTRMDERFSDDSEWDIEMENAERINNDIMDKLSYLYSDNMKYSSFDITLKISESDYLFWDNKTNFFHFNNKTNKFSVVKKEMLKDLGLGYCYIKEVYRDKEDILFVVECSKNSNRI